jgi:hypothetical protein
MVYTGVCNKLLMPSNLYTMQKFFHYFTEILGWLQIVASPFLTGLGIGCLVYFPHPNTTRLVIAIIISLAGLITGIYFANRIWKKKGTVWFMSRIMATPELDAPEEEQTKDSHASSKNEQSS